MTIRLLLADDQALVRGALATLLDLEPDMSVVAEVGRGDEVVAAAREAKPDVALLDVEMPHLDGVELCMRIRASERTASLPVILVTSLDQPEQRARGLEAGADAYVTKSGFDQDILLDTVRQLLGAPRRVAS